MDANIKECIRNTAEIELPMDQLKRLVAVAEPLIEHHLRHIDRPALSEHARAERGAKRAVGLVRRCELQVVARDRFMNGEEGEHPIVIFAKHGLHLRRRGVIWWWRHIEETHLTLIQRSRRVEEGAAVRTQEARGPGDLQRLLR